MSQADPQQAATLAARTAVGPIALAGPNNALWQAIVAMPLGLSAGGGDIRARLCQRYGLSRDSADQWVAEYRRFCYLMATDRRFLAPAPAVDEVWHLHLQHSERYWDDWCSTIVGRPMHHHPADAGPDSARETRTAYQRTLDAYQSAFGMPPSAVWPPADRLEQPVWRMADARRQLVVPRWLAAGAVVLSGGMAAALWPIVALALIGILVVPWLFLWLGQRFGGPGRGGAGCAAGMGGGCGTSSCGSGCGGGGCGGG